MKIVWQIESHDIKQVKVFYDSHRKNPFVEKRIERNVESSSIKVSKDDFFKAMICCLLTTQQRSGPNSAVTKFINTEPFPLNYQICISQTNLKIYAKELISNFGGLRRYNQIVDELVTNLNLLEENLWGEVFEIINGLQSIKSAQKEREAADFINDKLSGFGPKQSRNLLQSLGLTKYEIPFDSRITKWLNKFNFPIILSAGALSDRNYYNFVSDGFQKLCEECGIIPCVLDAVIFASFDGDTWTEKNVVW
jgi:thermostable 8-oxoguanine DNA glycosylase